MTEFARAFCNAGEFAPLIAFNALRRSPVSPPPTILLISAMSVSTCDWIVPRLSWKLEIPPLALSVNEVKLDFAET